MLKLQATSAFQFICKPIVDNAYYISWGLEVRKVSNSKSDLWHHSRSPYWCYSI